MSSGAFGERGWVLSRVCGATRKYLPLRNAKRERETKFGTQERKPENTKNICYLGTREREGKIEDRRHAGMQAFQERAPISGSRSWSRSQTKEKSRAQNKY